VWQAEVTFAVSQQALVELARLTHVDLAAFTPARRLPADGWHGLCAACGADGLASCDPDRFTEERFNSLRARYEPFALGLSERLLLPLPDIAPEHPAHVPLPATAEAVAVRSRRP
jgi:hypothetical protein